MRLTAVMNWLTPSTGSFVPQQFENNANPCFHELTTAREIIEQMDGRIDAVVIGAGTSGTFCGVARAVRKQNRDVLCVLVEPEGSIYGGKPAGPKKIEGIGQRDFIPKIFDRSLADEILMVQDEEVCAALKKIARLEGLLGGWSSGAAAAASYKIAERLGPGNAWSQFFQTALSDIGARGFLRKHRALYLVLCSLYFVRGASQLGSPTDQAPRTKNQEQRTKN